MRTAHNPPSSAFLDACDRLGLLVLDEPFDVWKAHKVKFDYGSDFDEWWKQDISSMVLRDRNHPSIVIWGIGNEIPELEVDRGAALGKQLADQVRSLDNTRPLTLAFPGTTTKPTAQAVFSQLDITGYNYNILPTYPKDHEQLPSRIMLTTESLAVEGISAVANLARQSVRDRRSHLDRHGLPGRVRHRRMAIRHPATGKDGGADGRHDGEHGHD